MASTHTKHSDEIKRIHLVSDTNHFYKSPSAVWSGVQEEVLLGKDTQRHVVPGSRGAGHMKG